MCKWCKMEMEYQVRLNLCLKAFTLSRWIMMHETKYIIKAISALMAFLRYILLTLWLNFDDNKIMFKFLTSLVKCFKVYDLSKVQPNLLKCKKTLFYKILEINSRLHHINSRLSIIVHKPSWQTIHVKKFSKEQSTD